MKYPKYPQDDRIILKPEIPEDKILLWKKDLDRKKLGYSENSMAHPAKMHMRLTQWIIKNMTEKGEIILDPMSGIGSTLFEASRLGRNALGIKYEEKFVDWTRKSIENMEKQMTMGERGKVKVLMGDARQLTDILSEQVDGIISSPPYLNTKAFQDQEFTLQSTKANPTPRKISEQNYGEGVDAVVMSPPFSQANKGGGIAKKGYEGKHGKDEKLHERHERQFTESKDNISNLPHGEIDSIILSPPHGSVISKRRGGKDKIYEDEIKLRQQRSGKKRPISPILVQQLNEAYSSDPENIGNLPSGNIDTIITSPPHGDVIKEGKEGTGATSDPGKWKKEFSGKEITGSGYSTVAVNKENLGNLKSKNYLSEMKKVYQNCYNVLKPRGKAIIVTKNFVRNKKVVRLDMDSIILLESCGFRLIDRYFRKILNPSFWIRNYWLKYPKLERVEYEDVLIFQKQ